VQIRYFAFLQDSSIFDQTDTTGIPMTTIIGEGKLTRGLEQGIKEMREGGVAYIFIPYPMAYGETGYKDRIPPRTNLMYRLELVAVKEEQ
jgi:FKBP-type peptidyl-prolyl cis-trans isomerase